jgi:hypothetical protein
LLADFNEFEETAMNQSQHNTEQKPMRNANTDANADVKKPSESAGASLKSAKSSDDESVLDGGSNGDVGKTVDGAPIGEGSYEGTHGYAERIDHYMENADVEADAKAAQPDSRADAVALREAEEEGKSRSKASGK